MRPALLILDPQNDFYENDNPNLVEFQHVIPTINAVIAAFRKRKLPIVFVQHTSRKKLQDTYPWEIFKEFNCYPEDTRLSKSYSNAFWKSELDTYLKYLRVDFVVIAGFVAEYCVLSTYRGARERGYQVTILQDAIASVDDNQRTKFVIDISNNISLSALAELLGSITGDERKNAKAL